MLSFKEKMLTRIRMATGESLLTAKTGRDNPQMSLS